MYPTEGELRRIKELPRGKQTEHFIYHLLLPKILGYWAFHGPKHGGKELADILVWWEDVVLLFEAKTKDTPDYPKESWIREKLRGAIKSINDRAGMLKRGEVDVLRNKWRGEVKWDPSGIKDYIGVIILNYNFDRENPSRYDPT